VPRVYEKVHTVALAGVEDGDPIKKAIFRRALATGARQRRIEREGRTPDPLQRIRHALAQRLVFDRIHGLFGGNLRMALTGAAPLGREVLDFFDACGIPIYEGFGMTETTAAATLNIPGAYRPGSVGRPLRGVDVAIAEDGEILMRGPNISPGYLHNEAATAETITPEGWLRSGDLGEIDTDGYLTIKGRKKDLIITSSGKNIAPSNIETELQETRWLSHAVVYGDNKPYLVALLSIDPDQAEALAEHAGVPAADPAVLAEVPEVRAILEETVSEVNGHYANIEQVKRFAVLDHDLSEADGELTPTMKVKRALVNERYREQFEALYTG
jgi:long-chain acyl-CoA synthetase